MGRKLAGLTAFAASVAAVGSGAVLAGALDDGPGQERAPVEEFSVRAERVAAPSAARGLSRAAGKPGGGATRSELIYLETPQPQTFEPGPVGATIKRCPKRATVVNGYYFMEGVFTGFGLANEGGSPAGPRKWSFYLENETTPPTPITGVTLGMVCLRTR